MYQITYPLGLWMSKMLVCHATIIGIVTLTCTLVGWQKLSHQPIEFYGTWKAILFVIISTFTILWAILVSPLLICPIPICYSIFSWPKHSPNLSRKCYMRNYLPLSPNGTKQRPHFLFLPQQWTHNYSYMLPIHDHWWLKSSM